VKFDSFVRLLMPKEERFRELLAQDTKNLVKAMRAFETIATCTSLEDRRVHAVELKAIEHAGDAITKQIFLALNSTFITPFDRDDIREIATHLDDILDYVEGVAQSFVVFELSESPAPLRQFAFILKEMADEIDRITALIWNLEDEQKIQAGTVRVSELENQADALYTTVIGDLFKTGGNPIEIMKWREVYEALEAACDACKDYTHAIGNVVVKNA
jgi:predicted phosphate transport protein (TIGR00153 family)